MTTNTQSNFSCLVHLVQDKARYERELKHHETVSVDSCTYYSRGKSGTRSLAERLCVYMYCPLYDECLLFVYLCVCFICPLLLFDCVRLYRIAGKYNNFYYYDILAKVGGC